MPVQTAPASSKQKPRVRSRTRPKATRQPEARELQELLEHLRNLDLPEEDGEPLESDFHVMQIPLLDEVVRQHLGETNDYFCGGNMFIYFSLKQAQEIVEFLSARRKKPPSYKGPDFFLVKGVDGSKPRGKWVVWEEDGRYPDLIIEVISPSTAAKDKNDNPKFYAKVFRTPEYFWYDPRTGEIGGYRLELDEYQPIAPNEQGWLWSNVLNAWLGVWEGVWHGRRYRWLRLYDAEGRLVPTQAEQERQRAEQERQRAEQERQLREQAEAELERLKAKLREQGIEP